MATSDPHRDPAEDGVTEPVPADIVSPQDGSSTPVQGRAQFTLTMLLLGIALVAVVIRLSMASWAGVMASALLVAAFLRTRSFAKWHRSARGRPASRSRLAGVFAWSAMLAIAILTVGFVFFGCTLSLAMMLSGPGHRGFGSAEAGVIGVALAILAMAVVAKNLWPVKPRDGSR